MWRCQNCKRSSLDDRENLRFRTRLREATDRWKMFVSDINSVIDEEKKEANLRIIGIEGGIIVEKHKIARPIGANSDDGV